VPFWQLVLTFFYQSSGDLVINNYGPLLYKSLGFGEVKQLLYPAAWLTFTLGMSVISIPVIDRFPRNKYLAFGLWGCMSCLIVEAALVANFVPSTNTNALQAAVAMFFCSQAFEPLCLAGTVWVYVNEICPTHLRAKGVCLSAATWALSNLIWLQAAPTGFATIGWKFYLPLIIISFIGGLCYWFLWPDTRGLPLEEVAAIFGDQDEVAIYLREVEIDHNTHNIIDHHTEKLQDKALRSSMDAVTPEATLDGNPPQSMEAKPSGAHTEHV